MEGGVVEGEWVGFEGSVCEKIIMREWKDEEWGEGGGGELKGCLIVT